jgi:hypothetical protein
MTKSQRATNQLITILQIAMGKLNIRGYFTTANGIWILHQNESDYPLAELRSVTVTDDKQIILDMPGRRKILIGESDLER